MSTICGANRCLTLIRSSFRSSPRVPRISPSIASALQPRSYVSIQPASWSQQGLRSAAADQQVTHRPCDTAYPNTAFHMSKGAKGAATAVAQAVRLLVPAGKATAAPPVGPALGARGVKSMDFCKEFNARTGHLAPGTPTPVTIAIQPDRTFTFEIKTPPTTWLIKQAAGIEIASGETGKAGSQPVATLSVKHIYEIAKIKQRDSHLRHVGLEKLGRSVVASCRSMGINIIP